MLKLIDINKIIPHPNNPRKELGELEELADSIKESGILQNLTIVPLEVIQDYLGAPEYYVIIGHRRLSAAKMAGITKVPCIIADMDEKTQVATMLLENMQRVDLTIYEQAQGFQMMLDFGESIKDISDKTGFSESTVRRRTKLLDLDQEGLKESGERGGTLADYARLGEIEGEELRNEVLATVGTDEFNWKLKRAIDQEKEEGMFSKALQELSKFAIEIEGEKENITRVTNYYGNDLNNIEIPEDFEETQYYFKKGNGFWITLYKESEINDSEDEEKEKKELEKAEREERESKLREIKERSYELRLEFIEGISNTKARRHMDAIIEATIYQMIHGRSVFITDVAESLGIESDEGDRANDRWESIQQEIWKQPEKNLLTLLYNSLDDEDQGYYNWGLEYGNNRRLDYVYEFLEKLGYKLSEEEKQIKEGTHELYTTDSE